MRKGVTAGVVGAVLGLGAFAAAQAPVYTVQADRSEVQRQVNWDATGRVVASSSKRTRLTGNVVIEVNGVAVRADRAVIEDGEVTLEGNVRLTLPQK